MSPSRCSTGLAAVGLIDDADFAEQWVRSRRARAGKGKRALVAELRTKGVDDDVIAAAVEDIDAGAERRRAEELVERKLRREVLADDSDDAKVMRRLVGCWPGAATARTWRLRWSATGWPPSGNAAGSDPARIVSPAQHQAATVVPGGRDLSDVRSAGLRHRLDRHAATGLAPDVTARIVARLPGIGDGRRNQ